MHDLGTLGGSSSWGLGINAGGQVTGNSRTVEDAATHAMLWTPSTPNGSNGTMIDLGSLAGPGGGSIGWDVNDSGQVAGDSYTTTGPKQHAFLWTPAIPGGTSGTMHDLGTLGGTFSSALAINNSGQVAGYSYTTGDLASRAFLWSPTMPNGPDGTMIDLGTLALGGNLSSYAYGINASGDVVGGSGDVVRHAFLYTGVNGIVDLNLLIDPLSGWQLILATAINDAGQITGYGLIGGEEHAFLLNPVPEPASLALLVVGAIFLVGRRSKRRPLFAHVALALFATAATACADIFKWEYINHADPAQGRQQSSTLAPDGAGVSAAPGENLSNRNLTMAYLIGANLSYEYVCDEFECYPVKDPANLSGSNLTQADFSNANVAFANLAGANLTGATTNNAIFYGAILSNANLGGADARNTDFSDASLDSATFSQADLTSARFDGAVVTSANFTGAKIRGANFANIDADPELTAAQLYSTASYAARDLSGINLYRHELSSVDLAGQNLTAANLASGTLTNTNFSGANLTRSNLVSATLKNANLSQANLTGANLFMASLTGADFTGADIRRADFTAYHSIGAIKLTLSQLYSTASYKDHDLTGIWLAGNDLDGVNFANQNLTSANFYTATLKNADFRQAVLTNTYFAQTNLSGANFSQTNLASLRFSGATMKGVNLAQADLTNTNFFRVPLDNANLTGAEVKGAIFYRDSDAAGNYGNGLTPAQLYSTASYEARDLSGIVLAGSNLAGANLVGQNLSGATFYYYFDDYNNFFSPALLTGANLSQANLTGARFGAWYGNGADLTNANLSQANLTNANLERTKLSGANLAGTEVRGANFGSLSGTGLTVAQLSSTASYQLGDLTGIGLEANNLTGINLAGQNLSNANLGGARLNNANLGQANLTNASLTYATLTGANLTGAEIRGVSFHQDSYSGDGTGITPAQLYSTASYQARDLAGISLIGDFAGLDFVGQNLPSASFRGSLSGANMSQANLANASFGHQYDPTDLIGANLSQAHLTGASFKSVNLTDANLSQADLTNAFFAGYYDDYGYYYPGSILTGANLSGADARAAILPDDTLTGANASNLIQPNGHIAGLDLAASASLVIRDYDGNAAASPPTGPLPIVVDEHLTMDAAGTLRLSFDADAWDSTILFAAGIPVTRGGTLELSFAADVDVASQLGRTIDLFDWTGVMPTGAFIVDSLFTWNLSNLYTTGEVTLLGIGAGTAGDFNNDGAVDAADLAQWQGDFGVNSMSDADNDGDSDGADFLAWQRQLGSVPAVATTPVVPEPGTLVLFIVASTGFHRIAGHKRQELINE